MTRFKHWARYYQPGSFFAEDSAEELSDRSVDAALAGAPHDAFAFVLYDTAICEVEFDAGLFRVVPIPQDESPKHYIGGDIFTGEELRALAVEEGDPDKYRVLIANVGGYENGLPVDGRAIRCRTGNWQPFEEGDVRVEALKS
jgi:hypothetical protein